MNDPMVDVQVSCVVGVDNDRAKLLDNLLDGFDHIQQINTVQSIVGQSQKPGRGGSEYNSGIPGGILQGIDRFFVGRCIAINFSRRRTLGDDDDPTRALADWRYRRRDPEVSAVYRYFSFEQIVHFKL